MSLTFAPSIAAFVYILPTLLANKKAFKSPLFRLDQNFDINYSHKNQA